LIDGSTDPQLRENVKPASNDQKQRDEAHAHEKPQPPADRIPYFALRHRPIPARRKKLRRTQR